MTDLIDISTERNDRQVANWLMLGVAMVVIQVLLGGITRLTGSGLSITEWNVVTGTLPPLNEQQWATEFSKYQQTPQYQLLNADFNIDQFKFIFFWEWFHRLWARLLGVVFAIGFTYFLMKGKLRKDMVKPFIILFLLGALQGAIGWIMVASGLVGDAVYVKPAKLALHFIFALGLLCYTFWFALKLRLPVQAFSYHKRLRQLNIGILLLLVLQLVYGALMAGHKAATAAATWPDINGSMLTPAGLWRPADGNLNFIDNKIMIHFLHRGMAYLLLALVAWWSIIAFQFKGSSLFMRLRWTPLAAVTLQVLLGIASVLTSTGIMPGHWGTFEWMAQLHQLIGMLFLLVMIGQLFINRRGQEAA